jgi:hypothetical protein
VRIHRRRIDRPNPVGETGSTSIKNVNGTSCALAIAVHFKNPRTADRITESRRAGVQS